MGVSDLRPSEYSSTNRRRASCPKPPSPLREPDVDITIPSIIAGDFLQVCGGKDFPFQRTCRIPSRKRRSAMKAPSGV